MVAHSLKALVVFKNNLYPELIRTVHFYKSEEGIKEVEREYVFYNDSPYEELICYRVLTLQKFCLSQQFVGLMNGVWLCIFVFNAVRGCPSDLNDVPTILSIPRNPKLATIPTLANDLRIIFKLNGGIDDVELNNSGESKSKRRRGVTLDLNSFPSLEQESEENDSLPG